MENKEEKKVVKQEVEQEDLKQAAGGKIPTDEQIRAYREWKKQTCPLRTL